MRDPLDERELPLARIEFGLTPCGNDDLLREMADGRAGDTRYSDARAFAFKAGVDAFLLLGLGVIKATENQAADLVQHSSKAQVA